MTTAFYSHPDCRGHDMGDGHPECPERLDAIDDHLSRHRPRRGARTARGARWSNLADLGLAHESRYVAELRDLLQRIAADGRPRAIDADTIAAAGTWQAVMRAAGAAVAATDAVIDGTVENAFCAVRPPGHHATRAQAMGFCFFNNVAVAARHALDVRGLERVAIVDFDVHHGNGTEDIIANDERVLMVSIFQHPLYPYSGAVPLGTNMVNVPVPPYTRGPQVRALIEENWLARARRVPAGDDLRLGRLRRAPRRRARPARPGRGRLHLDHRADQGGGAEARSAAGSSPAWKAATTSARWRAASPRTCAC